MSQQCEDMRLCSLPLSTLPLFISPSLPLLSSAFVLFSVLARQPRLASPVRLSVPLLPSLTPQATRQESKRNPHGLSYGRQMDGRTYRHMDTHPLPPHQHSYKEPYMEKVKNTSDITEILRHVGKFCCSFFLFFLLSLSLPSYLSYP